jgi:hypothetical protein
MNENFKFKVKYKGKLLHRKSLSTLFSLLHAEFISLRQTFENYSKQ